MREYCVRLLRGSSARASRRQTHSRAAAANRVFTLVVQYNPTRRCAWERLAGFTSCAQAAPNGRVVEKTDGKDTGQARPRKRRTNRESGCDVFGFHGSRRTTSDGK